MPKMEKNIFEMISLFSKSGLKIMKKVMSNVSDFQTLLLHKYYNFENAMTLQPHYSKK